MGSKFFEATEDGEYVFRFHRPKMFDDETRGHLMDAQKHALQAVREVVDAMLSAIEKREGEAGASGRRQNIDID